MMVLMMIMIKPACHSARTAVIELSNIINMLITQITALSHDCVFVCVCLLVVLPISPQLPNNPNTVKSTLCVGDRVFFCVEHLPITQYTPSF